MKQVLIKISLVRGLRNPPKTSPLKDILNCGNMNLSFFECVNVLSIVVLQMLQGFFRQLTSISDHAGPCQSKGYGINICPVEEHVVLRFLSGGQIVAVIVDQAEAVEPGEGRAPDKAVARCAGCIPAMQCTIKTGSPYKSLNDFDGIPCNEQRPSKRASPENFK